MHIILEDYLSNIIQARLQTFDKRISEDFVSVGLDVDFVTIAHLVRALFGIQSNDHDFIKWENILSLLKKMLELKLVSSKGPFINDVTQNSTPKCDINLLSHPPPLQKL